MPLEFTTEEKTRSNLWAIRKGLLTMAGAARVPGTSVITEDIAVSIDRLANVSSDLQEMFRSFEYNDAVLFGHALDGNMHMVFSQPFNNSREVDRYAALMQELSDIVVGKHSGSLKAEHGTGRNIAPFLKDEWGQAAVSLMEEIKDLFDPSHVLNPGVILNKNPRVHLENLKPMPLIDPLVDKCIECGFCESLCPSRELSLTPRQRISVAREIRHLSSLKDDDDETLSKTRKEVIHQMVQDYKHQGIDTCAMDGMCAEKCPVSINTGAFVGKLRSLNATSDWTKVVNDSSNESRDQTLAQRLSQRTVDLVADRFDVASKAASLLLRASSLARNVLGDQTMRFVSHTVLSKTLGLKGLVPEWNEFLPQAASDLVLPPNNHKHDQKVVYYPCCMTRMMGPSASDREQRSVHEAVVSVLDKARFKVLLVPQTEQTCCGCAFSSHGWPDKAAKKASELHGLLSDVSEGFRLPVLFDTSPCAEFFRQHLAKQGATFGIHKTAVFEPLEFVDLFVKDRVQWKASDAPVAVHLPCSSKKMRLNQSLQRVASLCSTTIVDSHVSCCGMAGDRGLLYPELTASATVSLNPDVRLCADGYSTSRSCEIGLSKASSIDFRSIMFLVDRSTLPLS